MRIKFNGSTSVYEMDLKIVNSNIIQFNKPIPKKVTVTKDFECLTEGGKVFGKYEGYSTIYRETEDYIQCSNDESVYVAPPTPEPVPEPEPYVPTLEEIKAQKISEMNTICNQSIVNGVSIEVDGEMEQFSYGIENGDQGNIDDLFNLATTTGLPQPYHANGGDCKLYSVEDVVELYVSQKMNKTHHTTYFNQLKGYISSLEYKENVLAIEYGQELIGQYLETYNAMMEQSQLIVNSVLEKAGVSVENIGLLNA